MSQIRNMDRLIDDTHLKNPSFMLGLWYAREVQKNRGLDPRDVPMKNRYTTEIGDALTAGVRNMLEFACVDSYVVDPEYNRFQIQERDGERLTIIDSVEEMQALLPRTNLLDQNFNLIAWYIDQIKIGRSRRDEASSKSDDLKSVTDSDTELMDVDSCSESEVPPLLPIESPDGLARMSATIHGVVIDDGLSFPNARFEVTQWDKVSYLIEDQLFDWDTFLPLKYLLNSNFSLARWYANQLAEALGIEGFDYMRTHFPNIQELMTDELKRYFADNSIEYPLLARTVVNRVRREPEDPEDGPEIYRVQVPGPDEDFVERISHHELTKPQFDVIGWVLTRPVRHRLAVNNLLEGFSHSFENSYLGFIFGDVQLPEDEFELYCGKAQIPADGYNGLRRTASMAKTPDRVVAKPLVIVALISFG
ncbi:hypothetical protein C8R45DRAFT_942665 [Mycena sanguinolenta]|nr:hypothetical protein C8R45DRAFT_942665 [Mycena sanguinolenta]